MLQAASSAADNLTVSARVGVILCRHGQVDGVRNQILQVRISKAWNVRGDVDVSRFPIEKAGNTDADAGNRRQLLKLPNEVCQRRDEGRKVGDDGWNLSSLARRPEFVHQTRFNGGSTYVDSKEVHKRFSLT